MGGYLNSYGAGEEKREKIVHRLLVWGAVVLVAALVFLFVFKFVIPNRAEQKQAERFFELLAAKDYKGAYALWGCTEAQPCRQYPFDAFVKDWGAEATPVTQVDVLDGESCGSGAIVTVDTGKAGDRKLWVEHKDKSISFLPPGMERCPKGNRIYDFVRSIRYRMHGRTFE